MKRAPVITKDGSHSIAVPELNVMYHSVHGALQESLHVFIHAGWAHWTAQNPGQPVRIFEMGFGTGLNVLLTMDEAMKSGTHVYYETLECDPLTTEEAMALNYCEQLQRPDLLPFFRQLHTSAWEADIKIHDSFILNKTKDDLLTFVPKNKSDIIYYDAFAPAAQPECWTIPVFKKLYSMMNPSAILVTYCSKSAVRRNMTAAGFHVEKIPGPRGKREMVRGNR